MHYYIDGYNLLFRLCHGYAKNITEERRQIIEEISHYVDTLGLTATLIFDGNTLPGDINRTHYSNLEILYTDSGETADEWILQHLKFQRNPNQIVVVTSDKRLAWRARNLSARTEGVETFLKSLERRTKKLLRPAKKTLSATLNLTEVTQAPALLPAIKPESEFDYYLRTFETMVVADQELQEKQKAAQPMKPKKAIKTKKKKKPTPSGRSAADYQKIFEERLEKIDETES